MTIVYWVEGKVEIVEACDPFKFNLTRKGPRQIDPPPFLMSELKKDLREVLQKQNGIPPPVFVKIWGGVKIFCFWWFMQP